MTLVKFILENPPVDPSAVSSPVDQAGNFIYSHHGYLQTGGSIHISGESRRYAAQTLNLIQLTRLMQQLSGLSDMAADMFTELNDEALRISNKLTDYGERIQRLSENESFIVEQIQNGETGAESVQGSNNSIEVSQEGKRPSKNIEAKILAAKMESLSIQKMYKNNSSMLETPQLHLLDKFRDDGLSSMRFYSYPKFFEEEWVALMKKEQEEKLKKRIKKKKKNNKKKLMSDVKVKRYNDMGELIPEDELKPAQIQNLPERTLHPLTPDAVQEQNYNNVSIELDNRSLTSSKEMLAQSKSKTALSSLGRKGQSSSVPNIDRIGEKTNISLGDSGKTSSITIPAPPKVAPPARQNIKKDVKVTVSSGSITIPPPPPSLPTQESSESPSITKKVPLVPPPPRLPAQQSSESPSITKKVPLVPPPPPMDIVTLDEPKQTPPSPLKYPSNIEQEESLKAKPVQNIPKISSVPPPPLPPPDLSSSNIALSQIDRKNSLEENKEEPQNVTIKINEQENTENVDSLPAAHLEPNVAHEKKQLEKKVKTNVPPPPPPPPSTMSLAASSDSKIPSAPSIPPIHLSGGTSLAPPAKAAQPTGSMSNLITADDLKSSAARLKSFSTNALDIPKKKDARDEMLDKIRGRTFNLRPVASKLKMEVEGMNSDGEIGSLKATTAWNGSNASFKSNNPMGNDIMSILARRAALEVSDSEEDDDDAENDDSDDSDSGNSDDEWEV